MRKVVAGILAAALALSAAACGSGKKEGKMKIAGVVYLEDQFMNLLQKGFKDGAEKAGVEILLANAGNDQNKETELINTYVSQGIQGIAIAPINEVTSLQTLKKASEKGMKIVIADLALSDQDFVSGGFTSSQYDLGRQTGEKAKAYIEKNLKDKAEINLAVVQFKSLLPNKSSERVQGFLDQLKDFPNVKVVADQDAWMQDSSLQVVGDMITAANAQGGIDIIYGANDGGTLGAVAAVRNAGLAGKTVVFGIDAAEQQVEMLRADDNILQAVTGQDPYTMGLKTVEFLVETLNGKADASKAGTSEVVPGLTLSRDDKAGIDAFEKSLKENLKG